MRSPNPVCPVTDHVLENEAEFSGTEKAPGHTPGAGQEPRPSKTLHQFDISTKTDHYFSKFQRGESGV